MVIKKKIEISANTQNQFYRSSFSMSVWVWKMSSISSKRSFMSKHTTLVNRKRVILQNDNVRAHTAKHTKKKNKIVSMEDTSKYSIITSFNSDLHFFRTFDKWRKFRNKIAKNRLSNIFLGENPNFFKCRIEIFPFHWAAVVENKDDYILDKWYLHKFKFPVI